VPVELKSVCSSNVDSVGYIEDKHRLIVKFKDKKLYAFDSVPKELYQAMLTTRSPGTLLHKEIKGKFKYTMIKEEELDE